MRFLSLFTVSFLLGCCPLETAQQVPKGAPIPQGPELAPVIPPITISPPGSSARHMDAVALQREAKELMDLSQSLQPEIEALSRGLLSRDVLDKLKRIEKVSKQLRGEIASGMH